MFRFYLSRVYKTRVALSNGESTTTSDFFRTPFLTRPFCANNAFEESSFTVPYLINSCGLSEKTAFSVSKKIQLISSSQPGLTVFRDNEMEARRSMLLSNADKTIRPKIEFFKSLGLSDSDLDKLLTKAPTILLRSVEKELMPSVAFLKSILPTESDIVSMIMYSPWLFAQAPQKRLEPSVALLLSHGVPAHNILKLLLWSPGILIRTTTKRLSVITKEAKGMQFDPSKYSFLRAIQALACMSKSSWETKGAVYKSWGWSDDDIHTAFTKQPQCMILSVKKITGCMEFLVNKMGYDSLRIAQNPLILMYSLEKRIIPRLSVLRVLTSNNIVQKDYSIGAVMQRTNEAFLKEFVIPFENQLPQLMPIYNGNVEYFSN